jgi:uncharacterized circularly permuted ATP-grasp superfamily protein
LPQTLKRVSDEEKAGASSQLPRKFFDDGTVRHAYAALAELLDGLSIDSLVTKQSAAEELFRRLGITFAVYGEGGSTERLIPFDLIPRILDRAEWDLVDRGCIQRVKAINTIAEIAYSAASLTYSPLPTGQAAHSSWSAPMRVSIAASVCTGEGVKRIRSVPRFTVG